MEIDDVTFFYCAVHFNVFQKTLVSNLSPYVHSLERDAERDKDRQAKLEKSRENKMLRKHPDDLISCHTIISILKIF